MRVDHFEKFKLRQMSKAAEALAAAAKSARQMQAEKLPSAAAPPHRMRVMSNAAEALVKVVALAERVGDGLEDLFVFLGVLAVQLLDGTHVLL